MRNYNAKTVDAYISAARKEARSTLKQLRRTVKAAVPKAEEGVSWGVPFYKQDGLLAGFSAFREHASFGFAAALPKDVRKELEKKGYKTGSKTVQIRFDQKVPAAVIKRIVRTQAKRNKARKARGA